MTYPASHIKISRSAFEDTIGALGEHGKKAIMDDLKSRGTCQRYLELADVSESLSRYFEVASPDLALSRVWIKVTKLSSQGALITANRVVLA
jgi:hypothetical protein